MNLRRFNEMTKLAGRRLVQSPLEFRSFLEFADAYFKSRSILKPIIVEVGTAYNAQKPFYQELLNGEYIGIDLGYQPYKDREVRFCPNIVGNSHSPETVEKLKKWLGGRLIDLLFIDADHSYESVKLDYEIYDPFVKHIVAFHDIYSHDPGSPLRCGVRPFWNELVAKERVLPMVMFKMGDCPPGRSFQMGIGLIIKGG